MGCRCHDESKDKPKAPITGPAQAECIYDRQINSPAVNSTDDAKRIAYRVLFRVVILPSLVFMMAAAIADELACGLEAALDALEDKGWPE